MSSEVSGWPSEGEETMQETGSPDARSKGPVASEDGCSAAPDLASQLEDLIRTVWESEANWRFDDRLDLASATDRRALYAGPAEPEGADARTAR